MVKAVTGSPWKVLRHCTLNVMMWGERVNIRTRTRKIRSSKSSTCTGRLRKLSPQGGTVRTSQVIHCAAFLKMKNQPLWTDKQEKTNLNRTKAVLAATSQNDGGQKTTGSTSNHWSRENGNMELDSYKTILHKYSHFKTQRNVEKTCHQ